MLTFDEEERLKAFLVAYQQVCAQYQVRVMGAEVQLFKDDDMLLEEHIAELKESVQLP